MYTTVKLNLRNYLRVVKFAKIHKTFTLRLSKPINAKIV